MQPPSRSPGRTRKTSLGVGTASYGKGDDGFRGGASEAQSRSHARGEQGVSSYGASSRAHGHASVASSSALAASSSSSLAAARRAHHILGGDDRLIFDIGARVTKVGHCGEARPRKISWSLADATPADQPVDEACQGILYALDVARCRDDTERKIVLYKLKARLKCLLRKSIHQTLTQDAKQRKCVIVENPFMPKVVKELVREILFDNLQVASVAFVSSHMMSAVAIGRQSALVLDVGYEQSSLVPVHHWRPLATLYTFTSPRAAKRLSERLKSLILQFGKYYPPHASAQASTSNLSSAFAHLDVGTTTGKSTKITPELLDDDFLDEIKAKALFVSPLSSVPGADLTKGTDGHGSDKLMAEGLTDDEAWMSEMRRRYESTSRTEDFVIDVPPSPPPLLAPASQPATIGQPSIAARTFRGAISVPGWIRERAAEVLFEQGDGDALSLTEMILEALLKLPIDVRATMASNIYIVGGTAMLPGLAHRLRLELVRTITAHSMQDTDSSLSTLVSLTRPSGGFFESRRALQTLSSGPPNRDTRTSLERDGKQSVDAVKVSEDGLADETFVSALGGDESFVTTGEGGEDPPENRQKASPRPNAALSKAKRRRYAALASLARLIAVVNDHAPRLDVNGQPVGAFAPAFPPNLSAWIGASVTGSLRIDAVDQMSRDEWDELQRKRKAVARDGADASGKGRDAERPSLGLGRGSFLGTVGGLDLGTYGPLSAGARNKFAATSSTTSPSAS